jgi:ribosomal protein S12 methylthiotransferase
MRGDLVSRPIGEVLREAEKLVKPACKELLVISQDTSAYGVDVKYAPASGAAPVQDALLELCEGAGELGVWVRLHYVYPYPQRRRHHPADGRGQDPAVPRRAVPARQPAHPQG